MTAPVTRLQVALTAVIALAILAVTGPIGVLIVAGVGGAGAVAMTVVVSVLLATAGSMSIRWSGVALAVAWGGAIVQMLAGLPVLPADLAILMVLYATGATSSRTLRLLGVASAVLGAVIAGVYLALPAYLADPLEQTALTVGALLIFAVLVTLILSWTFGVLVSAIRRGRAERAAATAAQLETVAEQERGRIARDMHDVVAHSLGVIVAQADGARYLAGADPGKAGEALETISGIAREALSDVRLLLTRLRHHQGELPQPGHAEIDALLAQFEEAGLEIQSRSTSAPERAPAAVQLAVYRLLQESLTNALRHGDRARPVLVDVAWAADGVELVVRSGLRAGTTVAEAGHGVTGMRERASLAGGSLSVGPVGGEFVVSAVLPFSAATDGGAR